MGFSTAQNVDFESAAWMKVLASGLPPIRGTWYFVDPYTGSASNDGSTPSTAFANISTAYTACTDGNGDGIAVLSGGTTSANTTSYLSAAIAWTKSDITVFGVCAPTRFNKRSRIANLSTANALANLLAISGYNNSFYNLSFYNGGTTGAGGVLLSGQRNYFYRTHFMGGMGMTVPTVNDYALQLSGSQENTFVDCVIGSDTFDKGDYAGAELLFASGCERDRFIGCELASFRSAGTTAGLIKLVGAGDAITRTVVFDKCFFQMYRDGNAPSEVGVVIGTMPNNGLIVFKDCLRVGFVDWATTATNRVYSGSATLHESGGLALAANPS